MSARRPSSRGAARGSPTERSRCWWDARRWSATTRRRSPSSRERRSRSRSDARSSSQRTRRPTTRRRPRRSGSARARSRWRSRGAGSARGRSAEEAWASLEDGAHDVAEGTHVRLTRATSQVRASRGGASARVRGPGVAQVGGSAAGLLRLDSGSAILEARDGEVSVAVPGGVIIARSDGGGRIARAGAGRRRADAGRGSSRGAQSLRRVNGEPSWPRAPHACSIVRAGRSAKRRRSARTVHLDPRLSLDRGRGAPIWSCPRARASPCTLRDCR